MPGISTTGLPATLFLAGPTGSGKSAVAVELADAVIRIADLCGYLGIDLDTVISEKMAYNETRPFKHGKRF